MGKLEYKILTYLGRQSGPVIQSKLGQDLEISETSLSRLISQMQKNKLIIKDRKREGRTQVNYIRISNGEVPRVQLTQNGQLDQKLASSKQKSPELESKGTKQFPEFWTFNNEDELTQKWQVELAKNGQLETENEKLRSDFSKFKNNFFLLKNQFKALNSSFDLKSKELEILQAENEQNTIGTFDDFVELLKKDNSVEGKLLFKTLFSQKGAKKTNRIINNNRYQRIGISIFNRLKAWREGVIL